jgi:hypothetical protein
VILGLGVYSTLSGLRHVRDALRRATSDPKGES